MGTEDWRLRIELERDDRQAFLERLRHGLGLEARELARALEESHLVVSRNDNDLVIYADSRAQASQARRVVEAELRERELTASMSRIEHWLDDEERWDNEPHGETWEEATLAQGYAPWEVRVSCRSHREATELAERLESEGYDPIRRWTFLIIGTATRDEADALAGRLDGEVEAGGAVVWGEALDSGVVRPFVLF